MDNEKLDFRFGWRRLLPLQKLGGFRIWGFNANEERFLFEALSPYLDVEGRCCADGLFVDADRHHPAGGAQACELDGVDVVCVVGHRRHVARWRELLNFAFPEVREYSLLPPTRPRVVVPLTSPRHVWRALAMHRPGRFVGRVFVATARLLAIFGNYTLIRERTLLVASRENSAAKMIRGSHANCGKPGFSYALYLGNPHGNRKDVILPLGETAPEVIVKVAESSDARQSLRNEIEALASLQCSRVAAFVPRIIQVVEQENSLMLCQEYRSRVRASESKTLKSVIEFLSELSLINHVKVPLSVVMTSLAHSAYRGANCEFWHAERAVILRLTQLAEQGFRVALNRTHGDFAPWNCAWTTNGLFVYDWEASCEHSVALGDAFYYAVSPALYVKPGTKAARVLKGAMQISKSVVRAGAIAEGDIKVYLALWLLARTDVAQLYREMLVELERSWS